MQITNINYDDMTKIWHASFTSSISFHPPATPSNLQLSTKSCHKKTATADTQEIAMTVKAQIHAQILYSSHLVLASFNKGGGKSHNHKNHNPTPFTHPPTYTQKTKNVQC